MKITQDILNDRWKSKEDERIRKKREKADTEEKSRFLQMIQERERVLSDKEREAEEALRKFREIANGTQRSEEKRKSVM